MCWERREWPKRRYRRRGGAPRKSRGWSRGAEPGAGPGGGARGGKEASCWVRTAASPAAPPAAPLTFHLQEKLPSGRRRRFPRPGELRPVQSVASGTLERQPLTSNGREPRPDVLAPRRAPYYFLCFLGTAEITPSTCTTNGATVAAAFGPRSWRNKVGRPGFSLHRTGPRLR